MIAINILCVVLSFIFVIASFSFYLLTRRGAKIIQDHIKEDSEKMEMILDYRNEIAKQTIKEVSNRFKQ